MPVSHIVLFKWKPGTSNDSVEAAMAALRAMAPQMPFVHELRCGASFTDARAQGYTHGLAVTLARREDLPVYAAHEAHVAVVEKHIKPHVADIVAVDFDGNAAGTTTAAVNSTDDALAQLLGDPSSPYYMEDQPVDNGHGQSYRVFANGPHTVGELLNAAIDRGAAKSLDFCVFREERTSYAQLRSRVHALSAALMSPAFGVAAGDRVAVAMRNFPEWPLAFLAAQNIGAVAVPLNGWWTGAEMEYGLQDSGAKVMLCDEERLSRVQSVGALAKLGIKAIVVRAATHATSADDASVHALEPLLQAHANAPAIAPPSATELGKDAAAVIMYTSGTTGHPKGVVQTHRNVLTQLKTATLGNAIAEKLGAPPPPLQPCMIATVPLFHVTGSHHIFLSTLVQSGKLCLMFKWDPAEALRLIESEKVTNWTGVPTMVQELMALPQFADADLSTVKGMGGGGAAMPKTLVKTMQRKLPSATPGQGYGLTEVNGGCVVISGKDYADRPTSTGQPYFYMQARTVDENGADAKGGRGELQLRGALTMREYWNKPEATRKAINADGWFATGDVATIDDAGFVYIVDRVKDLVIRGGENISCTEVEQVVYEACVDVVQELAVFGIPDKRLGEVVGMMVRTKRGQEGKLTQKDIIDAAAASGKLAKFKLPEHVFFTSDPLPRGATEKIQRREIKKQVLAILEKDPQSRL